LKDETFYIAENDEVMHFVLLKGGLGWFKRGRDNKENPIEFLLSSFAPLLAVIVCFLNGRNILLIFLK
jgi:hypothetical protein